MMFEAGQKVCGYQIIEQIGLGGFSEIYKARDKSGGFVTLKFPTDALIGDLSNHEWFHQEYAIAGKVNHPGLPQVISILDNGPTGPCLVFQYVEGRTLRIYLNERAPLPLAEALGIAVQLAGVLQYLHKNGIYHCDLKPENIIVDADGAVHLLDFGIALIEGARVTWGNLWNEAMGTAEYMSPEQIQGKRGDARTDVYALGVILYEMLTGMVPFRGDSPLAVMARLMAATPTAARTLTPAIPQVVELIVLKSIRRDPEERYKSAEALRHDLEHYTELSPSDFNLGPEKIVPEVGTDRETRVISGIIAAAFLVLAGLIVFIVIMFRRG